MAMPPWHRLSPAVLDAVASGTGEPELLDMLRAARLSKQLLLLRAVLDTVQLVAPPAQAARFLTTYEVLSEIQRRHPATVADVLRHPHVGAWLTHCLRQLRHGGRDTSSLRVDLAHLGAVTAAAALRCGSSAQVTAPVRSRSIAIPTLGRLHIDLDEACQLVDLSCGESAPAVPGDVPAVRVSSRAGGTPTVRSWEVLRRATVERDGAVLTVEIDDIDPYRDVHGLGATGRLPVDSWNEWVRHLWEAWDIIVAHHDRRAAAIAAGVVGLVPLSDRDREGSSSATTADAPGMVALTPPTDGLSLAVTLVHELQHTVLNGLLDLAPLLRPTGRLYYSPWRDDARPLCGLLHGTFAFYGVAGFWRTERSVTGPTRPLADFEFARTIEEVHVGQRELLGSGRLAPLGARLVRAIGDAVVRWTGEATDDNRRVARDLVADHRAKWRVRHLSPDPEQVVAVARAWSSGTPRPPVRRPAVRLVRHADYRSVDVRLPLARWRATRRGLPFSAGVLGGEPLPAELSGATVGDVHLLEGDYERAARAYAAQIAEEPTALGLWAGLAAAFGRLDGPDAALLSQRPELVRAIYLALATGTGKAVDVWTLAAWLVG